MVGLVIGLYKAVEYIEDKTYVAKKYIGIIIKGMSISHTLLLFRGVSILVILYSLSIQYIFYILLEIYPDVCPSNPTFIVGTCMALGNHFLMLRTMINGKHYVIEMILVFIFIVWTTPFCFFLSLSANDETLPSKGKKTSTWIGRLMKKYVGRETK
jgi:hypothetical protein